jgi:hypothetical protein
MEYTCVLLEYKEADLFIGGKKILKWIPHKWGEKTGMGLVCFRIQYNGGLLQIRRRMFGSLKSKHFLDKLPNCQGVKRSG